MRILVAEDDRLSRRMIEKYLTELGYQVWTAVDGREALRVYREQQIKLILTDWVMPNLDGLDLIKAIRSDESAHYAYIIVLTAQEDTAELVKGISAGADDYIRKPFDKEELAVRLRAGQRILNLHKQLENRAETDPLTGIPNRRSIGTFLKSKNITQLNAGGPMAFIMTDIDHFKKVNDTYGHDAGDLVIQGVSQLLHNHFRSYDHVSRVGGEEFFIIAPDIPQEAIINVVERMRLKIEQTTFHLPDEKTLHVTCSFGVCCATLEGEIDIDFFMKKADAALYRAKAGGRNCVMVHHHERLDPIPD